MLPPTWVLVAESSRARLFERQGRGLVELEDFSHPEGRSHNRDIDADRGGRAFDSVGEGRHAMEREHDPKRTESEAFARRLVARLEEGRVQGRFERLDLAAPPQFLGLLRAAMGPELADCVHNEIVKNVVRDKPEAIAAHFAV